MLSIPRHPYCKSNPNADINNCDNKVNPCANTKRKSKFLNRI